MDATEMPLQKAPLDYVQKSLVGWSGNDLFD